MIDVEYAGRVVLIGRIALLSGMALVVAACGGGDSGDSDDLAETTSTTTVEAPANPDGDYFILRWQTGSDNPTADFAEGLATTRLWNLTPDCTGDEACDLTLTGGGEGGSYDPPEFPRTEVLDDITLAYDAEAEAWVYEEDVGADANCRNSDGSYIQGDFTTMDVVVRTDLAWDDSGTRLVGTRTEAFTLNDAGRADPQCSEDSDEVITTQVVGVPQEEYDAANGGEVELVESYLQTEEVFASEGYPAGVNEVYTWRVNDEPTEGSGSCDPDQCDAALLIPYADSLELELSSEAGQLSGSGSTVDSCSSDASILAGEPEVLTDEGYTVESEWEIVTPVTLDDDGNQALVARGITTATPVEAAASEFPDDCATTQVIEAYYYLIPSDLLS